MNFLSRNDGKMSLKWWPFCPGLDKITFGWCQWRHMRDTLMDMQGQKTGKIEVVICINIYQKNPHYFRRKTNSFARTNNLKNLVVVMYITINACSLWPTFCRWLFKMIECWQKRPRRFVFNDSIDSKSALVRVMAWCRAGNGPLTE